MALANTNSGHPSYQSSQTQHSLADRLLGLACTDRELQVAPFVCASWKPGHTLQSDAHLLASRHCRTADILRPGVCRYLGYGGFFAGVYLIYQTKPLEALDIKYWARPRAEKELQVS